MALYLTMKRPPTQPMGITIAKHKDGLKEKHAGCPDTCRSAKPCEDCLTRHRLDLKQQQRTAQYRQCSPPRDGFICFNHRVKRFPLS